MASNEDIENLAGAHLLSLLPEVALEVEAMTKQVQSTVFKAISDKSFTPEQAYNAWMEVYAVERLGRRLNTRGRLAQGAGKSMAAKGEL